MERGCSGMRWSRTALRRESAVDQNQQAGIVPYPLASFRSSRLHQFAKECWWKQTVAWYRRHGNTCEKLNSCAPLSAHTHSSRSSWGVVVQVKNVYRRDPFSLIRKTLFHFVCWSTNLLMYKKPPSAGGENGPIRSVVTSWNGLETSYDDRFG